MSDKLTYSGFSANDPKYNKGPLPFAGSATEELIRQGKIPASGALLYGNVGTTSDPLLHGGVSEFEQSFNFVEDIAQSRFYTIAISEIRNKLGEPIVLATGEGIWTSFLPVKNISFSYTNYDNLAIPFSALGDIPILQRKKISTISISCYDLDDDRIERALIAWENRCFPKNKYVSYLEDIASEMVYKSYNVKGMLNFTKKLWVIPAGGVQVNRGYDVNSEKLVTFSVAAVGEKGYSPNSLGYNR